MSTTLTPDALTVDEALPSRSRTFSNEVVQRVHALFNPTEEGVKPANNVGIGTFAKEGGARSALTSLNKLLVEQFGERAHYASTVRKTEDGQYRAILLNKPRKAAPAKAAANGGTPEPAAPAKGGAKS